jgi:hypothetical protein
MVYELRTYRIPGGRMPDILNRFETITFNLFDKHSIQVVGFWTRTDVNELVYICKYESEEAMEKAWDAFRADPDWIAARDKTEANGPIVDEVISHVLIPTAFSPMQ